MRGISLVKKNRSCCLCLVTLIYSKYYLCCRKDIIYSAIETFQYGTQPSQQGNKDTMPKYVAHEDESSGQEENLRQTENTARRGNIIIIIIYPTF